MVHRRSGASDPASPSCRRSRAPFARCPGCRRATRRPRRSPSSSRRPRGSCRRDRPRASRARRTPAARAWPVCVAIVRVRREELRADLRVRALEVGALVALRRQVLEDPRRIAAATRVEQRDRVREVERDRLGALQHRRIARRALEVGRRPRSPCSRAAASSRGDTARARGCASPPARRRDPATTPGPRARACRSRPADRYPTTAAPTRYRSRRATPARSPSSPLVSACGIGLAGALRIGPRARTGTSARASRPVSTASLPRISRSLIELLLRGVAIVALDREHRDVRQRGRRRRIDRERLIEQRLRGFRDPSRRPRTPAR